jgi:prepilin-type N-terminal cleavage/methylation domain-containing protein
MSTSFKRSRSFSKQGGFTLVELLVVSAIIIIITAFLLLRQSSFNSAIILRGLAYSVALSVRQAQVYGTSVLGVGAAGSPQYAPAYGLYFDKDQSGQYVLFSDLPPGNGIYDSGEVVKTFLLGKGYTMTKFCVQGTQNRCSGGGAGDIAYLSILFKRPNPDALFVALDSTKTSFSNEVYSQSYVRVQSANGAYRNVIISATGQVSVSAPNAAEPW